MRCSSFSLQKYRLLMKHSFAWATQIFWNYPMLFYVRSSLRKLLYSEITKLICQLSDVIKTKQHSYLLLYILWATWLQMFKQNDGKTGTILVEHKQQKRAQKIRVKKSVRKIKSLYTKDTGIPLSARSSQPGR